MCDGVVGGWPGCGTFGLDALGWCSVLCCLGFAALERPLTANLFAFFAEPLLLRESRQLTRKHGWMLSGRHLLRFPQVGPINCVTGFNMRFCNW